MRVSVHNSCKDFDSYRAARVKSLFNVESGADFSLDADLPIDDGDWKIGLIVGPSGSGKTSMGRRIFGPDAFYEAGGTVYRLTDSMDGGPIIMQRRCAVLAGESAGELWRRALAPLGVAMLRDVVTAIGLRDGMRADAA